MSIPKEPRQLMINLMYLVLTAMLALNVSAEIINAFYALNGGLRKSNAIVGTTNDELKGAIAKQAAESPKYAEYGKGANDAAAISKDFETYVQGIYDNLIKEAGGMDKDHPGRPVRYKDKEVTTNLMVTNKKGDELLKKITETRQAFLSLITDPAERKTIEALIPLQADSIASDSKAKTWPEYKFGHMPVGAVLAILSKNVADAKTSETALMNHFFNKMSIQDIKFDKFRVAIAPKKSYLIRGDKFEADMFVAAFSSSPQGNVSIAVNGGGQSLKDGVAHYETTPSSLGKQTITVTGSVKNALTGETTSATPSTFEYEVGERSGSVSAEKMNVLYIGVDNPIEVTAAGVSSNSLNATGTNVTLTKKDANHYNARVTKVGEAIVTLTGENGFSFPKKFRVKRIPDPVAKLLVGSGDTRGGTINSGTMAAVPGLQAELENFDFEARCGITSYTIVVKKRNEDAIAKQGTGNAFSGEIKSALSGIRGGDIVSIYDIKALCPGDEITRKIGTMNFVIK